MNEQTQDGTLLPLGLTQDSLSSWMRDNPTTTVQDGIRAFINFQSRKEGKSPDQVILERYPGLGGQAPPSGAVLGSPGFRGGPVPFEGNPSTTPGQALSALGNTAAAVTPLGPGGALSRMAQMATRGATVGAGSSAVSKQDPLGGALSGGVTGAVAQGAGELLPAVASVGRRVWDIARNSFATSGNIIKWGEQYAQASIKGAIQEFPDFVRVLDKAKSYTDGLWKLTMAAPKGEGLRHKMLGEQFLGDAIQRTERMAKTVLGGDSAMVVVPTLRRSLMDPKEAAQHLALSQSASGRLNPSPFDEPLTVREAFEGLKDLARDARLTKDPREARVLWDNVEKARDEVLARVPKDIASEYITDLGRWGDGLVFLDALKQGFKGSTTHPTKTVFDVNGFLENLQERGLSEYFTRFNSALLKEAETGARETITKGFRGRLYKMGESATLTIPGHRVSPLGGQDKRIRYSPNQLATGLTLKGISEMTDASSATGSYVAE